MCPNNDKSYRIKFTDVTLSCRRYTIPDPSSTFMESINTRKLNYPINRTSVRVRQLLSGYKEHRISYISTGQAPYHIFCALVTDTQLSNINANPILLHTHNLKSFQLCKNSKFYPKRALDVSGDDANQTRTYKYFLEQMGVTSRSGDSGPTKDEYFTTQVCTFTKMFIKYYNTLHLSF